MKRPVIFSAVLAYNSWSNGTLFPSRHLHAATLTRDQFTVIAEAQAGRAASLEVGPGEAIRAGQRWQFTVRVRRPHGLLNPHGFDLELQSFEQGVGASASVREAPPPLLIERAAARFWGAV